ncbi:MAG TPA: hypothetical protein VFF06_25630 [Polyangia bacterium]|nr:hypothetical protein [Polyangia bacterium]
MTITREDPRFWDVRTIERRMRKGQLTRKDYEKHVKSVPDSADKAAPVDTGDDASDDSAE